MRRVREKKKDRCLKKKEKKKDRRKKENERGKRKVKVNGPFLNELVDVLLSHLLHFKKKKVNENEKTNERKKKKGERKEEEERRRRHCRIFPFFRIHEVCFFFPPSFLSSSFILSSLPFFTFFTSSC